MAETLPMYKGKPLVRSGKTIYYGFPSEKYVAMLQTLTIDKDSDPELPISEKVIVQIISTNETLSPKDRVVKMAEKKGLYEALRIADIWLERLLSDGEEAYNN